MEVLARAPRDNSYHISKKLLDYMQTSQRRLSKTSFTSSVHPSQKLDLGKEFWQRISWDELSGEPHPSRDRGAGGYMPASAALH